MSERCATDTIKHGSDVIRLEWKGTMCCKRSKLFPLNCMSTTTQSFLSSRMKEVGRKGKGAGWGGRRWGVGGGGGETIQTMMGGAMEEAGRRGTVMQIKTHY